MSKSDFLVSDEREIFDARVENRDKISRLVSAVSERKRESERRQQNTAAPKHSVARNRNSIAAANNIIVEENDSPAPPTYELDNLHIVIDDEPSRPPRAAIPGRDRHSLARGPARLTKTSEVLQAKRSVKAEATPGYNTTTEITSPKRKKAAVSASSSSSIAPPPPYQSTPLSDAIAKMDSRAKQAADRRAQLHAAATERVRERQRQLEEEQRRIELKQAQEYEKMVDENRRKKEEESGNEERKKSANRDMRTKIKRADAFRQFQLLARCGWTPWVRLINEKSVLEQKADYFARDCLLKRTWDSLVGYVRARRLDRVRLETKKSSLASAHYRRELLRSSWNRWKVLKRIGRAKAVAVQNQFIRFSYLKRSIQAWKISYERHQRARSHMSIRAAKRGQLCRFKYYFSIWRSYVDQSQLDREIEMRTRATWSKVKSWL